MVERLKVRSIGVGWGWGGLGCGGRWGALLGAYVVGSRRLIELLSVLVLRIQNSNQQRQVELSEQLAHVGKLAERGSMACRLKRCGRACVVRCDAVILPMRIALSLSHDFLTKSRHPSTNPKPPNPGSSMRGVQPPPPRPPPSACCRPFSWPSRCQSCAGLRWRPCQIWVRAALRMLALHAVVLS